MYVVALTGGIASGKTAVANSFANLGVPIIDTDLIAHELTASQSPYLNNIFEHFGPTIKNEDGSLNRHALANVVFNNTDERLWLEHYLHPLIIHNMQQQIAACNAAPYVLAVIPLLAEVGNTAEFDRILVVDAATATRRHRLKARNKLDDELIDKIFAAQASDAERNRIADDLIDNNGNLTELEQQILVLHKKYLALATQAQ